MQQLLGDREAATDGAFILELFLQHLPTNVRMVLAPTADMISVEDLAQLDQSGYSFHLRGGSSSARGGATAC